MQVSSPNITWDSYEFELITIRKALEYFLPQIEKHDNIATALEFFCDNYATITHLRKGSRYAFSQKNVQMVHDILGSMFLHYQFSWKSRWDFRIESADATGRVALPEDFDNNYLFENFLRENFQVNKYNYITNSTDTLRQWALGGHKIWFKLNNNRRVLVVGPIFDKAILSCVIPKLFKFKSHIILLCPKFRHQSYWRQLACNSNIKQIPLSIYMNAKRKHPVRFPLFAAFLNTRK